MIKLVVLLVCSTFTALAQQSALPFTLTVSERTDNLPTYVSPHLPNIYNATPNFKVGWGIDYPIGNVIINNEVWVMFNHGNQYGTHVLLARFKGTDFEHTVQQPDGAIDVEKDVSTHFLGGMWYDKAAGILYAPIHCEYKRDISPPAGWSRKKTRLATSRDKGLTWTLQGDILTDCLPAEDDWLKFSGSNFEAGPADFDFYADTSGGYFYIFSCNAYAPKNGSMNNYLWYNEAARSAIGDHMAPGTWHKFCNGSWTEPGLGGRSSKVSMTSYGIYGRVIYSTYLKKYLRIGPCMGVADKRYTDTGFTDHSIYLSTCDDLAVQDWTAKVKLFDTPGNDKLGITLTDGSSIDPFICGSTLRIYNYWLYNIPSRALDVVFAAGSTPAAGFPRYGSYAYEPLPESGDTIVHRATKIVGCSHPDIVYAAGAWSVKHDPHYYRTEIKESDTPGSSIRYSFSGTGIYWRAVADSDGGKADVSIDGAPAETVDCYFPESLPLQFAFIKTGLDAKRTHTISITVRADKNSHSRGAWIRHMAFEYEAESYAASAGFSSVRGKNNWQYQQRDGNTIGSLPFLYAETIHEGPAASGKEKFVYPNYWGSRKTALVGPNSQASGTVDAVRTFIAPHAGSLRIEGAIAIEHDTTAVVTALIQKNDDTPVQTATVTRAHSVVHDRIVTVNTGDALHFIVEKNDRGTQVNVMWDPVLTYVLTP